MLGLAHRGWSLRDYRHHIVHVLRDAGYRSILIGEQHIAKRARGDRLRRGDEDPDDARRERRAAGDGGAAASRTTARCSSRSASSRPTASSSGPGSLRDVHYSQPPANLPDAPEVRADVAAFKASARSLDHGVGMVLNALETAGLADDTLVIFTTDHGMPFPGAKATLYDRGLGVMLILRGPEPFHGGRVIDPLVSHIDIYPTICDFLGLERPVVPAGRLADAAAARRGRQRARGDLRRLDLARRLRAAARDPHDALQVHPPLGRSPHAGAAQHRRRARARTCCCATAGRSARSRPSSSSTCVYDPNEAHNLVGDPAHAGAHAELRDRLEAWMRETERPAAGRPRRPARRACEINLPDQRSAADPTTRVE